METSNTPQVTASRSGATLLLTFAMMGCAWGALLLFHLPGGSLRTGRAPSVAGLVLLLLGGMSPSLAAVIVTAATGGKAGLAHLWRRCVAVRFDSGSYAAIIGIPLVAAGAILIARVARGATVQSHPLGLSAAGVLAYLVLAFLTGPVGEELGWRGVLLDDALTVMRPLWAAVLLGVVWACWHLPLFFVPGTTQQLWGHPLADFAVFGVQIIALSIVLAWLYIRTNRSIWAVMLLHFSTNLVASLLARILDEARLDRSIGAAVFVLAALVVTTLRWEPATVQSGVA